MPRIDPAQLLRTLSQLLSPEGGIKSAEEVFNIVKIRNVNKQPTKKNNKFSLLFLKVIQADAIKLYHSKLMCVCLKVPRIVKLMQKFSKKLVSKCIYIHILRASEMDLLELFLQQKGWDLLNHW